MKQIADSLSSAIERGDVPNAYVLLGTTGCGKTTVSRIIARTVMCDEGTACGKCESCGMAEAADLAGHPDYTEINCGAAGKIDEMRGVIQMANQKPMIGRMRVFLLDEVHRLTPQAAEALLKPLEEPSEQTLWILATSEVNSIKDTLKNRCEFIPIKPIDADILGEYLADLARDYISVPGEDLLELTTEIAHTAGGYIRSALNLADSAIKMYNSHEGEVDLEEFFSEVRDKILSVTDADVHAAQELILATLLGNPKRILEILGSHSDFVPLARNMLMFTQYLLDCVYDVRGTNIYHPPVFREGNKQLLAVLKKRGLLDGKDGGTSKKIAALTLVIGRLTELYGKVMTFSCPERPLISSYLLNTLSDVRPITRTPPKK